MIEQISKTETERVIEQRYGSGACLAALARAIELVEKGNIAAASQWVKMAARYCEWMTANP